MTSRLPSKALEGRRVRILHSATTKEDGVTGEIKTVDTGTGNVIVALENGTDVTVNWGGGDRWMVIPTYTKS